MTDSSCDLPASWYEREDVICVPLDVRLGARDPAQLRQLPGEEFWRLVQESGELPTTAAPSPGAFAQAFFELERRGCDAAVAITISGELSATHHAAVTGAKESRIPVSVIDSRNATAGEGLLVLEAIELAGAGLPLDALTARIEAERRSIRTIGALDTLDYLRRGGRIGGAQAFFGSLLSIKPIVVIRDGKVDGEARERTRRRSLAHLAADVERAGPLRRMAVVHALAQDVDEFVGMLRDVPCEQPPIVAVMGPVIGAHTGIGTIGVAFQPVAAGR